MLTVNIFCYMFFSPSYLLQCCLFLPYCYFTFSLQCYTQALAVTEQKKRNSWISVFIFFLVTYLYFYVLGIPTLIEVGVGGGDIEI